MGQDMHHASQKSTPLDRPDGGMNLAGNTQPHYTAIPPPAQPAFPLIQRFFNASFCMMQAVGRQPGSISPNHNRRAQKEPPV